MATRLFQGKVNDELYTDFTELKNRMGFTNKGFIEAAMYRAIMKHNDDLESENLVKIAGEYFFDDWSKG